MPRQRRDKVDINQADIVKMLRNIPGVTVLTGMDDILVGYKGVNYYYEIKHREVVSKRTGLVLESAKKPSQKRLEAEWEGHYRIVCTVEQILSDLAITAEETM